MVAVGGVGWCWVLLGGVGLWWMMVVGTTTLIYLSDKKYIIVCHKFTT